MDRRTSDDIDNGNQSPGDSKGLNASFQPFSLKFSGAESQGLNIDAVDASRSTAHDGDM
eukprot:CAMPEP_0113715050 /NCGR_PEP_ID=MMETSP0038_2-20120614/33023_1 /TAXON_ID=2898 /ORGANISM="Cryptomonas paramecium" /LENGTH=58 /DNA_ID=CAMNT_0000642227 /DNA_START=128 /DNA_END=301 /DNA_ORIENTATION=+ /assembly_acc=CAM_ASM_000170